MVCFTVWPVKCNSAHHDGLVLVMKKRKTTFSTSNELVSGSLYITCSGIANYEREKKPGIYYLEKKNEIENWNKFVELDYELTGFTGNNGNNSKTEFFFLIFPFPRNKWKRKRHSRFWFTLKWNLIKKKNLYLWTFFRKLYPKPNV